MELLLSHRAAARPPLSALTKLTMAALTSFALAIVYASTMLIGEWGIHTAIMIAVILIVAGSNLIGRRCTPLLGACKVPKIRLQPS